MLCEEETAGDTWNLKGAKDMFQCPGGAVDKNLPATNITVCKIQSAAPVPPAGPEYWT